MSSQVYNSPVIVRGAGRMWRLAGAKVAARIMAGLRVAAVVS